MVGGLWMVFPKNPSKRFVYFSLVRGIYRNPSKTLHQPSNPPQKTTEKNAGSTIQSFCVGGATRPKKYSLAPRSFFLVTSLPSSIPKAVSVIVLFRLVAAAHAR